MFAQSFKIKDAKEILDSFFRDPAQIPTKLPKGLLLSILLYTIFNFPMVWLHLNLGFSFFCIEFLTTKMQKKPWSDYL